jgi:predicted RNase H-like nuclease (RuvC/YqgF family)
MTDTENVPVDMTDNRGSVEGAHENNETVFGATQEMQALNMHVMELKKEKQKQKTMLTKFKNNLERMYAAEADKSEIRYEIDNLWKMLGGMSKYN